jgi:hypothetical protein
MFQCQNVESINDPDDDHVIDGPRLTCGILNHFEASSEHPASQHSLVLELRSRQSRIGTWRGLRNRGKRMRLWGACAGHSRIVNPRYGLAGEPAVR